MFLSWYNHQFNLLIWHKIWLLDLTEQKKKKIICLFVVRNTEHNTKYHVIKITMLKMAKKIPSLGEC